MVGFGGNSLERQCQARRANDGSHRREVGPHDRRQGWIHFGDFGFAIGV